MVKMPASSFASYLRDANTCVTISEAVRFSVRGLGHALFCIKYKKTGRNSPGKVILKI